jgi:plasmid stabilization system protein ParE
LLAHALIAPMPQTLALALPPVGTSGLPDFDDALRIHPVWDALEQHSAGTIDAVAKRMWDARQAGAPDEDVQAAALSPLARQMPALLARSDAASRRRYVQLVAEQLRALQATPAAGTRPACRDLLDGRLDVRRQLPIGLQIRESQWLLDAATAPPPRWLPKPATSIEIEVLNRSVGGAALGMLSRLWADAPDGAAAGPACEPVIALLNRVAAQPPARRELAERLLFQPRAF